MTKSCLPQDVVPLPTELAVATADQAARDAEFVAGVLRELGFVPTADRPLRLPAAFLLRLGAALRLWRWEREGLFSGPDSTVPKAADATVEAFDLLNLPSGADGPDALQLPRRVVALFADRFAWHGRRELGADVVVDDHDDDALDDIARFLWELRHARRS